MFFIRPIYTETIKGKNGEWSEWPLTSKRVKAFMRRLGFVKVLVDYTTKDGPIYKWRKLSSL